MLLRRYMRRGVSEAVGVVIAFTIISIAMLYILLNFISVIPSIRGATSMPRSYTNERLVLFLARGKPQDKLYVKNVGSITSHISYIVVVNNKTLNKVIVRADQNDLCAVSPSLSISPGELISITCSNHTAVAVITRSGRVFSIDPKYYAMAIEEPVTVPAETVYGGMMLTTTSGLLRFLENPRGLVSGAINTSIGLTLVTNSSGSIAGSFRASLVIVGRNPANNRFNILAIGYGESGTYVDIRGTRYTLSSVASLRYRLKIENFTGTLNLGIGIHPCYINTSSTCTININGNADRILLYGASTATPGAVGLDPYVFVGDIDGNDNVEVIFVTQDFTTGSSSSINDRFTISSTTRNYVDSSIAPIRVVFSTVPVNSSRYSSAILSVRMFFWDNSEDDISDNDNRIIMRVGLYDIDTKQFVYSTHLSYHELNRYRNVRPFTTSYISKDFTVYIPNTGKIYCVAVEFLDPFHFEGSRNDTDLIIGLEYIGIVLAGRQ